MIARKTKSRTSTRIWPYTPEPSPPLEATHITIALDEDFKMAQEQPHARPISMASKKDHGLLSPNYRPTLDDVLNGRAPAPYTLNAYTAFLSQQHCLETLEFVTEAKNYTTKYEEYTTASDEQPLTTESSEGFELMQEWTRIMDVYLKPGAPREINLPAEERDDLIDEPYEPNPPKPEALNPAVQRMRDLMSDSIFIPFCNSVKTVSHASTYNALSNLSRPANLADTTSMTYDERSSAHRRQQSGRRKSPPPSSTFQPSRSPPQTSNRSSALTSALNRTSGGSGGNGGRLSQNLTNTSRTSESALTDDSGNGDQRTTEPESVMSPPLTPPTSDLPQSHSSTQNASIYTHASRASRSERTDSGGWKRMGMKIFGNKKKGSFHSDD